MQCRHYCVQWCRHHGDPMVVDLSKLRKVSIWFNEREFEELREQAEKKGLSVYAYAKQSILRRKLYSFLVAYELILYALAHLWWILYTISNI